MAKTFKDSRPVREMRKEKTKRSEQKRKAEDKMWKRMWNEELLAA